MDTEYYDNVEDEKRVLKKNVGVKFNTTMINAIAKAEAIFGFLWKHGSDVNDLTENEQAYREKFEEWRKSVLDVGNRQKKNCWAEIDMYKVHRKSYHTAFRPLDVNGNR